jgi:hypothetical protein
MRSGWRVINEENDLIEVAIMAESHFAVGLYRVTETPQSMCWSDKTTSMMAVTKLKSCTNMAVKSWRFMQWSSTLWSLAVQ